MTVIVLWVKIVFLFSRKGGIYKVINMSQTLGFEISTLIRGICFDFEKCLITGRISSLIQNTWTEIIWSYGVAKTLCYLRTMLVVSFLLDEESRRLFHGMTNTLKTIYDSSSNQRWSSMQWIVLFSDIGLQFICWRSCRPRTLANLPASKASKAVTLGLNMELKDR